MNLPLFVKVQAEPRKIWDKELSGLVMPHGMCATILHCMHMTNLHEIWNDFAR